MTPILGYKSDHPKAEHTKKINKQDKQTTTNKINHRMISIQKQNKTKTNFQLHKLQKEKRLIFKQNQRDHV